MTDLSDSLILPKTSAVRLYDLSVRQLDPTKDFSTGTPVTTSCEIRSALGLVRLVSVYWANWQACSAAVIPVWLLHQMSRRICPRGSLCVLLGRQAAKHQPPDLAKQRLVTFKDGEAV